MNIFKSLQDADFIGETRGLSQDFDDKPGIVNTIVDKFLKKARYFGEDIGLNVVFLQVDLKLE